jgi:hypothetical protein
MAGKAGSDLAALWLYGRFYAKIATYRALKRLSERIFRSVPDPDP